MPDYESNSLENSALTFIFCFFPAFEGGFIS